MTKQEFQELAQNIVLLDGATGSNLMAAGMPKGVCTEEWVLAHKNVIQNLQRAYIEAGSNIIYAPTFGGKPYHAWSAGPYGGDQPHSGFLFKRSRGCGRP